MVILKKKKATKVLVAENTVVKFYDTEIVTVTPEAVVLRTGGW